jgi:ABC-type tungstate transport system permease subunit
MAAMRFPGSVLGVAVAATLLLAPGLARADNATTVTVLGTSDVSDSGLSQNVIGPLFKAAFPQYTYRYVGSATGTAINNAEQGNGGPSALIVHAASLENQFVAGGFSYGEQFGSAIFTNDFVLAGPATAENTKADVLADAPHNIAKAFADVAAAGVAGTASFISRGGTTTASGTTVQEHALWKLMFDSGLTPAGVVVCDVSAADGGGMSPIDPGTQATSGQPCPDSGTVASPHNPPWYLINTGANQGANVLATDACTIAGAVAGGCYSLTDRGTYDYLVSGTDPAGTITHLQIVTRDNDAAAPGGANELTNYFHVYVINPAKPGQTVNLQGAQDFVSLLTSATFQSQLKTYLDNTSDPGGAPFKADAAPGITSAASSGSVTGGRPVTVSGTVSQPQPGYPALAGATVTVSRLAGIVPVAVASGRTDGSGHYSLAFTPGASGAYQVSTGAIAQIENANLTPQYGDILSPAAAPAFSVNVTGAASITRATASPGAVQVAGSVGPVAPDGNAQVEILARPAKSTGAFTVIGSQTLAAGQSAFAVSAKLGQGGWTVQARYSDPGLVSPGSSATATVTVPSTRGPSVAVKKLSVKRGTVTLTGTLGSAPAGSNGSLRLFALAGGRTAKFKQVARITIKKGHRAFTIKHRFARRHRYVLQLEYVHSGQSTTFSKFSYVNVH